MSSLVVRPACSCLFVSIGGTNGLSDQQGGAKYDVSTSHYWDRGTGTGSWKVLPAS
ncbi:hypothetical protein ACIA74_39015 [Streptomyces sp. NPDC051658]|uniref:hypothetical protein n=1 Tax=unclassified Streptomyces TaxID=2593676 RepID=UPI003791D02E|nr:hypothetical protein OG520_38720 [Streptomyces sp. NBC_00984]